MKAKTPSKLHKIPKQKHINAVGIEFEGGWAKYIHTDGRGAKFGELGITEKRKKAPKALKYDGSVEIQKPEASWKGEIASPPLQIRNVRAWITRNRPEVVNKTCGTHVHVSLKNTEKYIQLTDQKFIDQYLSRLQRWGSKHNIQPKAEFWQRLQGKNSYCRKEFRPEDQLYHQDRGGHRYTQVNYCYGLWKTVEFRTLPAFETPWLTTDSILETLRIVEDYLETAPALTNRWEMEQEYETPETESIIYEETATPRQINNYKTKRQHFDEHGWISRNGLKLTGKATPLEEYVVTNQQAYLVPENVSNTAIIMTPDRYNRENNDFWGNTHELYNNEEE